MRDKKEIKTNMNNDLYNRYTYQSNPTNMSSIDRISFHSTCNNDEPQINDFTNMQKSNQNNYIERSLPQINNRDESVNNQKIYNYNNTNNP